MKLKKPKFWDLKEPNLISYLLLPLTLPYFIKSRLFNNNKKENDKTKKICVGNIYIGGTGKTPLSILISEILNQDKKKSVVVKKFYKDQIDEQRLIQKYTKLIISKTRFEGLKEAKKNTFDYVVFDDGLQDPSISYDLKIVCFNNKQWIGNGFLVPAGPLRETIHSLRKYDVVVINGDKSKNFEIKKKILDINSKIKIFESHYILKNSNDFDIKKKYISFSCIGNNQNFQEFLRLHNLQILHEFNFPDHYNLSPKEINKILESAKLNNAEIITTEKDFLRVNEEFRKKIKFLKIEVKMHDYEKFTNIINNLI